MTKSETIIKIKNKKVIAVIRGASFEEGYHSSVACIDGHLDAIEVAYTNNNASDIIKELLQNYKTNEDVLIGAGTVLDDITARYAIIAGAQFIVSPSFNKETAITCNRYGIPYIPGCMTITEIVTAMEYGCEIVKIFPGSAFDSSYIKAIKAPLPQVSVMVTGGVKIDNLKEWFEAGVDAVGVGGELNKLGEQGKFNEITKIANEYVDTKNNVKN